MQSLIITEEKGFQTPATLTKDLSGGMERVKKQLLHSTSCICKVQQRQGKANKPNWNHSSAPSLFFLWCHATNCPGALLRSPQGAGLARAAEGCRNKHALEFGLCPGRQLPLLLPPAPWGQPASRQTRCMERRERGKCKRRHFAASRKSFPKAHSPSKFGWTRLCRHSLQPRVRQKVLQWLHWIEVGNGTKQALGWSHLPQTMRFLTFADWLCDYK